MSTHILVLGNYKAREDHKQFIKFCTPLFDSMASLGVTNKTYVKPNQDPEQLGLDMQVGVFVEVANVSARKQLEKFLTENSLTYTLEPIEGWEEGKDVIPVPVWGKVKFLINELFAEHRYSDDPALVVFLYRLENAIEAENLPEFYRALEAVLKKVTLPEDKLAYFKERLFLFNIYYFEL